MNHDLKVFVYGTLKPGGHYWPEFCEGKLAAEPIAAKIRGLLYDLHAGYPGLLLKGHKWVLGYILKFKTNQHLERLDYLEGYRSDRPDSQNEYNRLKVTCFGIGGEPLGKVWTYEMTKATAARHEGTLIGNGDWPVEQK